MGTHPIFESDFDCLTDNMGEIENDDVILDNVAKYRWFVSLLLGPIWGILGLKGLFGIALYGLIISIFSVMLVRNHGSSAMDLCGGFNSVVKEGAITAGAVFMISWVISNTALN